MYNIKMSNNSIYDERHFDQFYNNIDFLMEKVNIKKLEVLDPSISEIIKVNNLILDYSRTNKRKIYGGIALDYLLKDKKAEEKIYKEYECPDIDFYTPDPMNDLIKLCNLINEQNFKFVRGREALHKETYAIYVNNRLYCNLSYVPKNIYNKIPFKQIDGLNIVHPYFLVIDYLRIFTDPIVSYWRLKDKKTFERFYLLNKYYSLPFSDKNINFENPENIEIIKPIFSKILETTSDSETLIHTGFYAYNYYLKESMIIDKKLHRFKTLDIPYYELISTNYKEDTLNIINKIKELVDDDKDIKIIENYQFFQYLGSCAKIYYKDNLVCVLYDNNNRCVPIKKNNKYLVCTFNYTLLYFLSLQMKYKVENDEDNKNLIYIIVSHLTEMKKYYFRRTKKTIFDNTPFEDFSLDYKGATLSAEKERQLIGEQRKKNNKPFLFAYEPSNKKDQEIKKYIFSNTSGNIINNIKKSKLFSIIDEESDHEIEEIEES
jgi:hypothetical protein